MNFDDERTVKTDIFFHGSWTCFLVPANLPSPILNPQPIPPPPPPHSTPQQAVTYIHPALEATFIIIASHKTEITQEKWRYSSWNCFNPFPREPFLSKVIHQITQYQITHWEIRCSSGTPNDIKSHAPGSTQTTHKRQPTQTPQWKHN